MTVWLALALLPILDAPALPVDAAGVAPAQSVPADAPDLDRPSLTLVADDTDDPPNGNTAAGDDPTGEPEGAAPDLGDPADRTGTWEAGLRLTANGERSGKVEGLVGLTPSFALYLLDALQFRTELPIYYAKENPDSIGVGGNFGFRGYAYRNDYLGLFGEVHGGVLWTSERFPDEGTYFNFTYHFGAGASFRVAEDIDLELGARFQHVSNFFIEGRDRNPASNMYGGFVGFSVPY